MVNPTRRLYLVRHGITLWNREMRMQGHTDIALDEEGRLQAALLAARLAASERPPRSVWSSDLQRAQATAAAIAQACRVELQVTSLLRETMLGDWEGLTAEEIEARGDGSLLALYRRDSFTHRPPGAETMAAAWERLLCAGKTIRAACPAEDIAVVGHGGSLRILVCEALGAPPTSIRSLWLDNASLSVIEEPIGERGQIRRITLLNDTGHLRSSI